MTRCAGDTSDREGPGRELDGAKAARRARRRWEVGDFESVGAQELSPLVGFDVTDSLNDLAERRESLAVPVELEVFEYLSIGLCESDRICEGLEGGTVNGIRYTVCSVPGH